VVRSAVEVVSRRRAARDGACIGDVVHGGVDGVATAPVMDGEVIELGHAWIKREQGEIDTSKRSA
jgi:hypothetical protein